MADSIISVFGDDTPETLRERLLDSPEFRERWLYLVTERLAGESIRCRTDALQRIVAAEAARVFRITAVEAARKAIDLRDDLLAMDCDTEATATAELLIGHVFRRSVDLCVRAVRRAIASTN